MRPQPSENGESTGTDLLFVTETDHVCLKCCVGTSIPSRIDRPSKAYFSLIQPTMTVTIPKEIRFATGPMKVVYFCHCAHAGSHDTWSPALYETFGNSEHATGYKPTRHGCLTSRVRQFQSVIRSDTVVKNVSGFKNTSDGVAGVAISSPLRYSSSSARATPLPPRLDCARYILAICWAVVASSGCLSGLTLRNRGNRSAIPRESTSPIAALRADEAGQRSWCWCR